MIEESFLHRIVQTKNDWLAQSFLIYLTVADIDLGDKNHLDRYY